MLKPVPLPDGSYADSARSFVSQDILNLIRVNAEAQGTRSPYIYRSVPGLLPVCAMVDISRQRGGYVCEGRLLVVMDQTLWQVSADFTLTSLGDIPGNGRVCFSHDQIANGNEVLITNGTQGFIFNTLTATLTQITDSGFLGGLLAAFIGNRFLSLDPARRRFQNSELADGLNWNSSEFYLGESSPDRIRALATLNNEVVLLNETTIEHFAYTGTTNALFENKGISIARGCAATHAVSVMDNALYLIGDDGSAYEKRGYELHRITSHAIEGKWRKNDLSKAFSFTWEEGGHKVWYVTFPVGEEAGTWGFDAATRKFHRRESYGMHRWRLAWCVKWNGDWYGGEYNGGRIFRLDWDYPLEGSDCLSRELGSGVMHNNGNRFTVPAVRLTVEAGPTVAAVSVTPQEPPVPVDSTFVYAVNTGANRLQYFDIPGFVAQGTIAVGSGPTTLCKNSTGTTLYVVNQSSDSISVVTTATNTVTDTYSDADIDAPFGIAISPSDLHLFVSHVDVGSGDYAISKLLAADGSVLLTTILPDLGNGEVAVSDDGLSVFVTNPGTNTLHRLDTATLTVQDSTTAFANDTMGCTFFTAADETTTYICTVVGDGVNVQTLKMLAPSTLNEAFSVDLSPETGNGSLCVLPDKSKLYVAGNISGNLSVVELTGTPSVDSVIDLPATARPRRCCASALGAYVFVTDSNLANLYAIDTSDDTIAATMTTGAGGNGVVCI